MEANGRLAFPQILLVGESAEAMLRLFTCFCSVQR